MKNKKKYSKSIIITILVIALFLTLCLFNVFGQFGSSISNFLIGFFGLASYAYALSTLVICVLLLLGGQVFLKKRTIAKYIALFVVLLLALHTATTKDLFDGTFAQYLMGCFNKTNNFGCTAGGMLIGIITYFPAQLLSYVGALILFCLAFVGMAFLSLTGNKIIQSNFRSKKVEFSQNSATITEFKKKQVKEEPVKNVGAELFVANIGANKSPEIEREKVKANEERVVNYEPIDNIFGSTLSGSGILSQEFEKKEEIVAEPVVESTSRKQAFDKLFNFQNSYNPNAIVDDAVINETAPQTESAEERLFIDRLNSNTEKTSGSTYMPYENKSENKLTEEVVENIDDTTSNDDQEGDKRDDPFFNLVFESNPNAFTNGYFREQKRKNLEAEERAKNSAYSDMSLGFKPEDDFDNDNRLGKVLNSLHSDDIKPVYVEEKEEEVFVSNYEEPAVEEEESQPLDQLFGFGVPQKDSSTTKKSSLSAYDSAFDRIFRATDDEEEKVEEQDTVTVEESVPVEYVEEPVEEVAEEKSAPAPKRDFSDITNGNFNTASQKAKKTKSDKVIPGQISMVEETPEVERKPYCAPPLNLIPKDPASDINNEDEHREYTEKLNQILADFKVDGHVSGIVVGPAFTRYEITLKPGVSVTRVTNLSKDIAVGLGGLNIRIEAPVPGKTCVGIELPNRERSTVSLRSVLEKSDFFTAKSPLTVCLGRNISGNSITCNLADMPHLLVAGTTGSGKSVCLNSILCSILYKSSPEDVRLILVDPKRVELNKYNGLPHMLIKNSITEAPKVIRAMDWLISEMDSRYDLFSKCKLNDIKDYNKRVEETGEGKKLPYILMVIDEIGDLMLVVKNDIEDRIQRLAQLARAAGIHLIVATQRPDVNVITGTIKANLPSRIAFAVTTAGDSTTILGYGGAEKLLGKGDMLFSSRTAPTPVRIQCAFIHGDDVQKVTDYVKKKNDAFFDENIEKTIATAPASSNGKSVGGAGGEDDVDELFYDVLKYAISKGTISVSDIQRRFKMGFNRAGRVVDQMYDRNFISKQENSKPREVLITQEQFDELYTDTGDAN